MARQRIRFSQALDSDFASQQELDDAIIESTRQEINQSSHGFTAGEPIRHNGTTWVAALANDETTLADGVVDEVVDTNNFVINYGGYISGLSGLTAGETYYTSDSVAGDVTTTEPTISNPLYKAISTTAALVRIFPNFNSGSSGSGSSSGINYTDNSDFESGTTDWSASGTGMSLAITTTSGQVLRGSQSLLLTADGTQTAGVGYWEGSLSQFAEADTNKIIGISFDLKQLTGVSDAAYVVLRDTDAGVDYHSGILPSGQVSFSTNSISTSSRNYALRIYANIATAFTMSIDFVVVGPTVKSQGAKSTDWTPWTAPTGSWVANTSYSGFHRRDGGDLIALLRVDTTGAPTSASLTIDLPNAYTADESRLPVPAGESVVLSSTNGHAEGPGGGNQICAYYTEGDSTFVRLANQIDSSRILANPVNQANPFTWGNGDWLTIGFRIPISQFADDVDTITAPSTVQYIFNSDTSSSDDSTTSNFQNGAIGGRVPNLSSSTGHNQNIYKEMSFARPPQHVRLEFQIAGSGPWLSGIFPQYYMEDTGGTDYYTGAKVTRVSDTNFRVEFGGYGAERIETSGVTAWSDLFTNGTRYRLIGSDNPWFGEIPTQSRTVQVRDEKSNGTDGGTFTSGSDQTRDLNTVNDPNDWGFASVASNQVTLTPGVYALRWSAPAYQVNGHKSHLYDITNSSAVSGGEGTSENCDNTGQVQTSSLGSVVVSISIPTTYEVRHRCDTTRSTDGFGINSGYGIVEVYTTLEITKLL